MYCHKNVTPVDPSTTENAPNLEGAILEMPLPENHWLYQTDAEGFSGPAPMTLRLGKDDPMRAKLTELLRPAIQYGLRAASSCGREDDLDPDALVQNVLIGIFGYHTDDGLSDEQFANPKDVPPLCGGLDFASLKADAAGAYSERNYLVAVLARVYPSGVRDTTIEGWKPEWNGCCYIDLPTGQISFHYHESLKSLFEDLPAYEKPWDNHTKDDVMERLVSCINGDVAVSTESLMDTVVQARDLYSLIKQRVQLSFHSEVDAAPGSAIRFTCDDVAKLLPKRMQDDFAQFKRELNVGLDQFIVP